jgi:hypothetical protein
VFPLWELRLSSANPGSSPGQAPGIPAATIEAESLSHKKQNLLTDNVKPGVMTR